ncbi:MAG TPA: CBS and ACT domain-containing protein [Thermoanaerobaculia bacterium]|jgi:acetoin utilization protein AcuB|nr:CBS and ACT domain-containing protein [Thermoanaerobaculia bacterium]
MLVGKWMTKKLVTVEESDSVSAAMRLLKEKKVRRLPVLRKGKLAGIVTDRDLKEASPSKATSLDIWELHFLLEKLTVKDVMTKSPITIRPDATIEHAALVLMEKRIGGLPVVDAAGALVGILTEDDVFRALVEVTGVKLKKTRVSLLVPDAAGTIREVADICRDNGGKIFSILVSYAEVPRGAREVIIRVDSPNMMALKKELASRFRDVTVERD